MVCSLGARRKNVDQISPQKVGGYKIVPLPFFMAPEIAFWSGFLKSLVSCISTLIRGANSFQIFKIPCLEAGKLNELQS
jgi:hypothetical protein